MADDTRERAEALLPCPFCGDRATQEHLENGRHSVGCINDGCIGFVSSTTFARKADAAAFWNSRPGEQAARNAALEEAADIARRGSDVARGWINPVSRDERYDELLYASLREAQEIEKAIRALKDVGTP